MTSSPTAGWLRCRMFTNVEVPPRASSRRDVAVLVCGTDALATAIPAALATTAADATATIAPVPNLRLMWSMALPLVAGGGRRTLPVSARAGTGPGAAPRMVAGYPPMVVLTGQVHNMAQRLPGTAFTGADAAQLPLCRSGRQRAFGRVRRRCGDGSPIRLVPVAAGRWGWPPGLDRLGHLELDQARRQAGGVHGVVAGQGVDPQHVFGVKQGRGDRRGKPGHVDGRAETVHGDLVIAGRGHDPELVGAVVWRGGIGRRAEVRREVDDAGPGQVVHRDVVPGAALVVAAEAEPGHVLDVDTVGPVPAVVQGDQVARVRGQAERLGLERAAQLQRVLPGAAVDDVVSRREGGAEDVERAHELIVAAAERDLFRADAAVAAGDDVVAGAASNRDRGRARHGRRQVVVAAAAEDGDRRVAGQERVFGTDDPSRVVAEAAANRNGDVADAGADDAEAVVAVAELDAQLPDTRHREPGVDGAVETEVDGHLTVAHGDLKDVPGWGPGDGQDSVLQPRGRPGRGTGRGGGGAEQAGDRGGHGHTDGQPHAGVHLLLLSAKAGPLPDHRVRPGAAGPAPGGAVGRDLGETARASGQLSVLSCTAGSTGCGARRVHRLTVTSGTAANTFRGAAASRHGAGFTKTQPGCPQHQAIASRQTHNLAAGRLIPREADPDGRPHSLQTRG